MLPFVSTYNELITCSIVIFNCSLRLSSDRKGIMKTLPSCTSNINKYWRTNSVQTIIYVPFTVTILNVIRRRKLGISTE